MKSLNKNDNTTGLLEHKVAPWRPKSLTIAIAIASFSSLVAISAQATDLEIYSGASQGAANIMMVLDTSGSMGTYSMKEDYGNAWDCAIITDKYGYYIRDLPGGYKKVAKQTLSYTDSTDSANNFSIDLDLYGCKAGKRTTGNNPTWVETSGSTVYKLDRLSKLKVALVGALLDPVQLASKHKVGLTTFPYYDFAGVIEVAAKPLTADQRKLLAQRIASLKANGGTPSAHALAEAGAYLLGTTTYGNGNDSGYGILRNRPEGQRTDILNSSLTNFNSPINASQQCDGYGIYFLTDGVPNNSSITRAGSVMAKSLGYSNSRLGCNSALADGDSGGQSAWSCMGQYMRGLKTGSIIPDSIKDGLGQTDLSIATATVGFGKSFAGLTLNTDGSYDCNSTTDTDIKNLCLLGQKGAGYGEGGFYYTEDSAEIAASIKKFVDDTGSTKIEPISTGSMSLPLDSLGGFNSRKFAYLPILEPVPGQAALWKGNLKKYYVSNATLKGADPAKNFVFKNSEGEFATDTWDIWNTIDDPLRKNPDSKGNVTDGIPDDALRPDKGLPRVGGTYQKIFENTGTTRNLFVNNSGSLVSPQVNTSKALVNFDTLTSYGPEQKRTLLNFMGYEVPSSIAVTDGTALTNVTQNKWLKNHGGVLHSVPQLVTTKVDIDGSGIFDTTTRKDYLLYGSMDGALHLVDDASGKEMFTFVPKQILDLQPAALIGSGTTVNGSTPYGVDAPWLTYVAYTTKATQVPGTGGAAATTKNTYEASKIFAMGGLRMGGSTYYGLDITDVSAPKLLYSVGSTYANKLQGLTKTEGSIKNDTVTSDVSGTTATTEQKAFSRMGQTWAQPTIGYVKRNGKRVMVNFLPGGYDVCYENPEFKLNSTDAVSTDCTNKSEAQGNAMYMVQVGVEGTNATTKESTFDTSSGAGNLLWWASNTGTGNDSTTRSTGLQYSKKTDLKHSIVTQVRALDRNYDGLTDHIYFADLGGQVWRADINNDKDTDNFKIDRVVKILDVSNQASGTDAPPRFYERPLITFYNDKYVFTDAANTTGSYNGVMAMVTVGTGDRSSPVGEKKPGIPVTSERTTPDAIYSVIDKDVTRQDLFEYGSAAQTISMRTPVIQASNLAKLTFGADDVDTYGPDGSINKAGIPTKMRTNAAQGWYMPLTHWKTDGTIADAKASSGKYRLKMFNEPDALAGILLLSTYNPDGGNTSADCSAGVVGTTQVERACMPFGVCLDSNGKSIVTARAIEQSGAGIMDNFITQYNDSTVFTSLKNRCEGADCKPKLICPDGNCNVKIDPTCIGPNCDKFDTCSGPYCDSGSSVNVDKRINPLSWLEH